MRIGISCLQINPAYVGGVNTYTLGLLEGFSSIGTDCEFRLYVTAANQHIFEQFRGRKQFEITVIDRLSSTSRHWICRGTLLSGSATFYEFVSNCIWQTIRERIDTEVELLYVPTVILQFFNARTPTVLSMHDIQHAHYPEFFDWRRKLSRRITYGLSARRATYLQASSAFIKRDLLEYFPNLLPQRVEVIPEGVNLQEFGITNRDSTLSGRYGLPKRYLLCPAQLWPHKNHLTLLTALKKIESEHGCQIPLALTGASFSAGPQIFEYIAANQMSYIHYLGKVPIADLIGLYQRATFVVSAGLYESNSLPILEAAAAGVPIIASRIPPNEELGAVLQLNLFDPSDANDLARVVLRLWKNQAVASQQVIHNRTSVGCYSWENTARRYVSLFKRIVN